MLICMLMVFFIYITKNINMHINLIIYIFEVEDTISVYLQ